MLSPSSRTVRATFVEQFAPVLRVHADVLEGCAPAFDVDAARARIRSGNVGYDALRVLASCGDLRPRFAQVLDAFEVAGFVSNDDRRAILDVEPDVDDLRPRFAQVLDAFEVAGFVSNDDRRAILDAEPDVDDLLSGWFTGDRTPRDARRRVARQVAIVVGNAMLRAASALVGPAALWKGWARMVCPCCGGSPDMVLVERGAHRTLVCARCDAQWRARRGGCLGCDTSEVASLARISNPPLGYDLVMCNACGRFIKERPRRGLESLIVERALTTELDLAAEQRGLRI